MRQVWREAAQDVAEGARRRGLWDALARNDIRHRYSGSVLGSFWITANIALLVLCLTFVFSGPLGANHQRYIPYVAIGLVVWHFILASLSEAATMFVASAETIRHSTVPLSVQSFRLVWRNAIVFAHNAVIIPVVLIAFQVDLGPGAVSAAAGLALLILALLPATLVLAMLGARFRDVHQIMTNLLQLLFFATPIFWFPSALGPDRAWIASFNPVFAFIDIVRSPLLGAAPAPSSWPVALTVTLLSLASASIGFALFRNRVAYWI